LELGHLRYANRHNYEDYLGESGRKRLGNRKWRRKVEEAVEGFREALLPDYVVLGGGNAKKLKRLPPQTRRGDNAHAFLGGVRYWERNHRNAEGPIGIEWTIADEGNWQPRSG
jgi:polyphosphate glucokinase